MDFESVRPIVSGLIGGVISVWLLNKLANPPSKTWGTKGVDELVQENKAKILISNVLFFASIAGGLLLYHYGYFERNDWRGLALTFGVATVSPAVFLLLSSIYGDGQRFKETFLAYAVAQRVPVVVLYASFALGAVCLFAAFGSMIGS